MKFLLAVFTATLLLNLSGFADDYYITNGSFEELVDGIRPTNITQLTWTCGDCFVPYTSLRFTVNPDNFPFVTTGTAPNFSRWFCYSWYQPSYGTSDNFYRYSYTKVDVPYNWYTRSSGSNNNPERGKQEPFGYNSSTDTNQRGYAGIRFEAVLNATNNYTEIHNESYREYIQQNLLHPLKDDSCYNVSFYVSLGPGMTDTHQVYQGVVEYAYAEFIGAFFSNEEIVRKTENILTYPDTYEILPQIQNPSTMKLNQTGGEDGLNWMKIEGTICPDEDLSFITIGNFKPNLLHGGLILDSIKKYMPTTWKTNKLDMAYFIDSISIKNMNEIPDSIVTCESLKNSAYLILNNEESDTSKCCYKLKIDRTHKLKKSVFDIKIRNKGDASLIYSEENNISTTLNVIEIDFCVNRTDFTTSSEIIVEYQINDVIICTDTFSVNCFCGCNLLDSLDYNVGGKPFDFDKTGCDSNQCCFDISYKNITNCIQTISEISLHIPPFVNPLSYNVTDNTSDALNLNNILPFYTAIWSNPPSTTLLKPGEVIHLGRICVILSEPGTITIPLNFTIRKDSCNYYEIPESVTCTKPDSEDTTDCCDNIKISMIPHRDDTGNCLYDAVVEWLNTPCCDFGFIEAEIIGDPSSGLGIPMVGNTWRRAVYGPFNSSNVYPGDILLINIKDINFNILCQYNIMIPDSTCDTVIVFKGSNWDSVGTGYGKIKVLDDNDGNAIGLAVYPNPVDDILNIDFNMPELRNYNLEITDILGNKVYNKNEVKSNSLLNHHSVDTKNWNSGTYILKVSYDNQIISKTFVISR